MAIIPTFLILSLFTSAFFVAAGSKNKEFKRMVAFGDSELDTGNVYNDLTNRTYPPSPPYYKGRYSDGPVYIERLFYFLEKYTSGSHLRSLQNYAYGAATTDDQLVQGRTYDKIEVPGILQQVRMYLKNSKSSDVPQSQRLYFVEGGENNIFFNATITIGETVSSLLQSVKLLLSSGAKHVFLISFSPFQYVPAVVALGEQTQAFVANYFIEGNQLLLNATKNLAGVTLVDVYQITLNIINNPKTYGFSDNSTACVQISNTTSVCNNPNQHIFWDSYHLTTAVHKILAEKVLYQIRNKL